MAAGLSGAEDAVNAAETPMGKYMRAVTSSVERKWHLYRRQNADVVTFGNLKLRFFVTKEGKPVDMEVLSKPDEADVRMADFTLRAIKGYCRQRTTAEFLKEIGVG